MPLYEFECACGKITEDFAKIGTESIACPKCGNPARKIISRCSFELKGGGWYTDGYASKGSAASAKTDSSSSSKSD
jgi:putative FmdB family regulatory protein